MRASLSYTPSPCPIDPQTIAAHTRLTSSADAGLVQLYAQAATEMIEAYLGRYLINRQVTWTVSEHPHRFMSDYNESMLPWPWTTVIQHPILTLPRPASAIASVTVGLWGQPDLTLVEGTDYEVDLTTQPARIRWISNAFRQTEKDHLQVTFTSGFGTDISAVPVSIQHAILLCVTSMYENRGDTSPAVITQAMDVLLSQYRFYSFG